ncbi:MAG: hypothetical protein IT167_03730 [Bryobacterales bacterium]|nr:hypothetical protein [Bryobacterales bacterium]
MKVNGISSTNAAQDYGPADRPKGIEGAAASFEALFIGNLLKSVREASQGALGGEGDQAGSTMMDVAEEYLANDIAKGGGLGLAKLVAGQFAAHYGMSSGPSGNTRPDSQQSGAFSERAFPTARSPHPQNEH